MEKMAQGDPEKVVLLTRREQGRTGIWALGAERRKSWGDSAGGGDPRSQTDVFCLVYIGISKNANNNGLKIKELHIKTEV